MDETWENFQQATGIVIRHQQWVDQLINPTLNGTWNRSIICGLYVYLFEYADRLQELQFRGGTGTFVSSHLAFRHLQLGCLLFESLLRSIYNPLAGAKLKEILERPNLKDDFESRKKQAWPTVQTTVAQIHSWIKDNSISTAFLVTARLRNEVSHNLAGDTLSQIPESIKNSMCK